MCASPLSATVLRQKYAFSKIAIANEKTAPYGVAAVEVMEKYGIYNKITHKIVRGDNIAPTYQFVFTENAQLGFVALSQVIHETEGSCWVVPQEDYRPIRQQAVLLNKSAGEPAALAFVAFLKGKTAHDIILSYGYGFDN
ncbi:molybdate ABC transporter substrate-binding protein [Terasakiella pusilla]|uniref:molybdate ABC transporter substrate-binding protein n=1 Tax=Terasakiella pusilla TaxID=64973 RepID=UPI003AA8A116